MLRNVFSFVSINTSSGIEIEEKIHNKQTNNIS